MTKLLVGLSLGLLGGAITSAQEAATAPTIRPAATTFADDLNFLRKHTNIALLTDRGGDALVAVAPDLQGRVMTSSAEGINGLSFGWINRELLAGPKREHFNPYGGEDRIWLGPEGGQFSIFFAPGAAFDLEHWYTPAALDTEPFEVVSRGTDRILCRRRFELTNYSGAKFSVEIAREVQVLSAEQAWKELGLEPLPGAKLVAYHSYNNLKNVGNEPWRRESGLLSIWILGMYNPTPATTVFIPIHPGPESELGPKITTEYFGEIPPDRLIVRDDVIFFKADGKYRSKIGIPPRRARRIMGSYDADNAVLTLVQFTVPPGASEYVNSLWRLQDNPYGGDAANSYNDGPTSPGGKPLGPFYELESSSPAAALAPGHALTHIHRTFHIRAPDRELEVIARSAAGVGIQQIIRAFPR